MRARAATPWARGRVSAMHSKLPLALSSATSRTFAISISSPQPRPPPHLYHTRGLTFSTPSLSLDPPEGPIYIHQHFHLILSAKMTSRAGLRFFANTTRQSQTHTFIRDTFRSRNAFRRHQTTTAAPAETQSFAQRMWTSEVGVKTVHFWYAILSHNQPPSYTYILT